MDVAAAHRNVHSPDREGRGNSVLSTGIPRPKIKGALGQEAGPASGSHTGGKGDRRRSGLYAIREEPGSSDPSANGRSLESSHSPKAPRERKRGDSFGGTRNNGHACLLQKDENQLKRRHGLPAARSGLTAF
jgi:hypothetical protein